MEDDNAKTDLQNGETILLSERGFNRGEDELGRCKILSLRCTDGFLFFFFLGHCYGSGNHLLFLSFFPPLIFYSFITYLTRCMDRSIAAPEVLILF